MISMHGKLERRVGKSRLNLGRWLPLPDSPGHVLRAFELSVDLPAPDARKPFDLIGPCDLDQMADDRCFYEPALAQGGFMLIDPVRVKLSPDRF